MPKLDIKITPRFTNWQQTINSAIYPMTYCVRMKKFNKTMSLIYQFCKYIAENAIFQYIGHVMNWQIFLSPCIVTECWVPQVHLLWLTFQTVHCCCELTILYSPFSSTVSTVFTNHELYVLKKAIIQNHSWNIGSKVFQIWYLIYIFHFIQYSGSVLLHAVTEHYLVSRLHIFGVLLSLFHTIN